MPEVQLLFFGILTTDKISDKFVNNFFTFNNNYTEECDVKLVMQSFIFYFVTFV